MGLKVESHINAVEVHIVCTRGGLSYIFLTCAVRSISQRFYAMATKERRKNNSKKNSNKSTGQESILIEGNTSSQLKDNSISQKLDMLLDVVKGLDAKVQDQDARLQKQEERVSIANVSALPSAHSSPKKATEQPEKLPSFEELKTNSKIQAEVDRRLQEYHNASRSEFSGKPNTVLKSGRFRTGVARVKNQVCWPQDFCTVLGTKQPTYNEMNLEQWVQGFMYCILDQNDNKIRENMMLYFTLLMQDAIELSPNTARRAHAAVLQEMERGKVSWSQIDLVEKIKCRHTQRILQSHKPTSTGFQNQVCVHYNKGQCKFENEHVSNNVLYQHYCSYCIKETQRKYDHPASKCMRMKNANGSVKSESNKPKQIEQRV